MINFALAVALALVSEPVAQAPSPDAPKCLAHASAIADTVKAMSWTTLIKEGETSAPRASVIAGEQAVLAVSIQTRTGLMMADGCGPYQGPIGPNAYRDSVLACREANRSRAGDAVPAQCDRATWQPDSGAL